MKPIPLDGLLQLQSTLKVAAIKPLTVSVCALACRTSLFLISIILIHALVKLNSCCCCPLASRPGSLAGSVPRDTQKIPVVPLEDEAGKH